MLAAGPGVDHGRVDPAQRPDALGGLRAQQALVRRSLEHEMAELAQIHPGRQLLEMLLTGIMALLIQDAVKIAALDAVIHTRFQIHDHAAPGRGPKLADAAGRQRTAGVRARAADLTDKAAVFAAPHGSKPAQQNGDRIVEDHDLLAEDAAAFQLRIQGGGDQLPLAAGDDHFLVDALHASVDLRRDFRREGEAEAHLVGPVQQGHYVVGREGYELLPCGRALDAGHLPLAQLLHPVTGIVKGDERSAEVGAAGVDHDNRPILRDRAVVAEVGGDHGKGTVIACEPAFHLLHHLQGIPRGLDPCGIHTVPFQEISCRAHMLP